jgi:uncharacterized protein (DUF305 family)
MRIKSLFAALSALVLLAGCSQIMGDPSSEALGPDEKMFVEMMVPHHEQAIQMSDLAPSRTQTPEVLAMAEKIKLGQEPEIELMEGWLGEGHSHDNSHAGHGGMDGMLTEDEMAALEAASGSDFDKLFLEGMIKHHEGAIEMLSLLDSSEDAKVLELRDQIEAVQLDEIAQMKALLDNN